MYRGRRSHIRRSDAFWAAAYEAWRVSGLTQKDYCNSEGISWRTFRARLREMRHSDPTVARSPRSKYSKPLFVPVKVIHPSPAVATPTTKSATTMPTLEVAVRGDRRVIVRPDFDVPTLRKLVLALETLPC